jgi:putative mycofactocin binding protein MftB
VTTPASSELDAVYRLAPSVSLRPERFGALAYSFDTRKLSFLKHPDLVAVVESLDGTRTLGAAFDHVGVAPARRPSFLRAVQTLEQSQMIVRDDEVPGAA